MAFDSLTQARDSVESMRQRIDVDPSAKQQLKAIADALGEAEGRLQALEAVVTELAVRAKIKQARAVGLGANSIYLQKLLGALRA